MNILFFVHTPLQLFVAQQIICQEKYENVTFLLGTIGQNKAFYEAFDLMLGGNAKCTIYRMDELASWAHLSRRHLLFDLYKTYIREKKIRSILEEEKIDMIYMGDMNNLSCKFAALLYNRLGFKIGFYEEGASHYCWDQYPDNFPFINSVLARLTDCFFYKPIWHFSFGKYMFFKSQLSFCDLPISKRYSILPKYDENFDVQLYVQPIKNKKLEEYIKTDLSGFDEQCNVTLFLSEPVLEYGGNERICLDVIKDYLNADTETDCFLLKYHPRETEVMKKKIEELFVQTGKNYKILSPSVVLPVELYLLYLSPKNVALFLTSTFLYMKYLSPHTQIKFLIYDYALRCSQNGYDVSTLKRTMKELGL